MKPLLLIAAILVFAMLAVRGMYEARAAAVEFRTRDEQTNTIYALAYTLLVGLFAMILAAEVAWP